MTAGQRPTLPDASDVTEAEPVSQIRQAFPEQGAIEAIFAEAQRLKA